MERFYTFSGFLKWNLDKHPQAAISLWNKLVIAMSAEF